MLRVLRAIDAMAETFVEPVLAEAWAIQHSGRGCFWRIGTFSEQAHNEADDGDRGLQPQDGCSRVFDLDYGLVVLASPPHANNWKAALPTPPRQALARVSVCLHASRRATAHLDIAPDCAIPFGHRVLVFGRHGRPYLNLLRGGEAYTF